MKLSKIVVTTLAGTILFSASAFAGNSNKGTLRLAEKTSVEGKQLNAGTYRVEWEGAGPDVQVNILQGKETVATLPAHVVEQNKANTSDAYTSVAEADGTRSLTVIYVSGKKFALTFDQKEASQLSGGQTSK
jgi:hypothetical protein